MTSTRLLARNTALNMFGLVAPLLVALVAVPILISYLGRERFGVLTLAWALIGYFGLFDFGLGRALTQAVSEALGTGETERLSGLTRTSILLMMGLGLVGSVLCAAAAHWLARDILKMEPALRDEAAWSFYLLAISLPFVLGTIGLRGVFEAHQHFGLATALRLPYAIFNFVGPLLIIPFSTSLVPIVAVLVAGRIALFVAHGYFAFRRYAWLRGGASATIGAIVPLLKVGGWMTVSNVISPMMVNLDRFVIGALISMTAVAWYATPFDMVTKLLFVPAAVLGVFFPAFASSYVTDPKRTAVIFDRATRFTLFVVFPVALVIVAFAREGLHLWVGEDFARESTVVLQLLAAGVLINSMAQVPFGLIQATRRADLTAKLHAVELPIYAIMIFGFARLIGLPGVALAWMLRMTIDTVMLCWIAKRQLPEISTGIGRALAWLGAMSVTLLIVALPASLALRFALAAAALAIFLATSWSGLLLPPERDVLRGFLLRKRSARPA